MPLNLKSPSVVYAEVGSNFVVDFVRCARCENKRCKSLILFTNISVMFVVVTPWI